MWHSLSRIGFPIYRGCLKDLKIFLQVLIELHNGRHISTTIIVVGGRPYCYQFLVEHVFVPLHHQLVRTGN